MAFANSERIDIEIGTQGDPKGVDVVASSMEAVTPIAEKAAEAITGVAEATEKIQPPAGAAAVTDWFGELIEGVTAAQREVEATEARLRSLSEVQLDVLAAQVREVAQAAREAGESTEEFDAKLASITAAQDAATAATIEANAASKEASEAYWARANDLGTLASGYVDVKNATNAATTSTAEMTKGIRAGTGALRGMEGASRGSARGIMGLVRLIAGGALSNPWTYVVAATGLVIKKFFDMRSEIAAINEEIKKTEAEGLIRLAENAERAGKAAADMADKSFKTMEDRAKSSADSLKRAYDYQVAMQRLEDERDNAQMAADLSEVDVAESDKSITASQATARRSQIRQGYTDRKTERSIIDKQRQIGNNTIAETKAESSVIDLETQLQDAYAKLKEAQFDQAFARELDQLNASLNKADNGRRPENTADTYQQSITTLTNTVQKLMEQVQIKDKEYATIKADNETNNAKLRAEIDSIKLVAGLSKKAEANRTGIAIAEKQNQETDQAGAALQKQRAEFDALTPQQKLQQTINPQVAPYSREGGTVRGNLSRKIQELTKGLQDGDQGGEADALETAFREFAELSVKQHYATKREMTDLRTTIKGYADELRQLQSQQKNGANR